MGRKTTVRMPRLRWVALPASVLVACTHLAPSTHPSGAPPTAPIPAITSVLAPGESGRIAFVSSADGDLDIYVMNADGSDVVQLTLNDSVDFTPSWSSDGTRIAFASDRDGDADIYVMDADGSHVRRLTDSLTQDFSPSWSNDGTRIAFESTRTGVADVYV